MLFIGVMLGAYAIIGTFASALSDPTGDEICYYPFLGAGVYEFDTKQEANHAMMLLAQINVDNYLEKRGVLWWKKYSVWVQSGFSWDSEKGREIVSIITHASRTEEEHQ